MQDLAVGGTIHGHKLLEKVGVVRYKIPSGEVTNIPMLERIAATGKPVLLSSGMSDWKELDAAVAVFKGKVDLTVLQCATEYPCADKSVGLNVIIFKIFNEQNSWQGAMRFLDKSGAPLTNLKIKLTP